MAGLCFYFAAKAAMVINPLLFKQLPYDGLEPFKTPELMRPG